ncbi:MAG: hypothetical protein AAFP99_10825 [Pseudomonadota bacterium]
MRDFSLRLPYLIYLSIGALLVGVLVAPAFRDMPEPEQRPMSMMPMEMEEGMTHPMREVVSDTPPSLTMAVEKDSMDGWNITLAPENFEFTPERAGADGAPNTGHAHLYIDGAKVARLYGVHYHVPDLPPGQYEFVVTLSSNDHAYYTLDGERIEARATITQGEATVDMPME